MRYLTVNPVEWAIADLYFKENPGVKKLRRKDEHSWLKFALKYFASQETQSEKDGARQDREELLKSRTLTYFKGVNKGIITRYERWRSDDLRVHSFERTQVDGTDKIFASAVHSKLGAGGEASVKIVESKDGQVLAKRSTRERSFATTEHFAKAAKELATVLEQPYEIYVTSKRDPCREQKMHIESYGRTYKSRTIMPLYNASLYDILVKTRSQATRAALIKICMLIFAEIDKLEMKGFIHRDIKPDNIMVETADGKPTLENISEWKLSLIDLGFSIRFEDGEDAIPSDNAGTSAYQGPEVLTGYQHRHSDRYALGVMLSWIFDNTDARLSESIEEKLCRPNPAERSSPTEIKDILEKEYSAKALRS